MSNVRYWMFTLLLLSGLSAGTLAPQDAQAQQERNLFAPEASAHADGLIFAQNPAGTVFGIDAATGVVR